VVFDWRKKSVGIIGRTFRLALSSSRFAHHAGYLQLLRTHGNSRSFRSHRVIQFEIQTAITPLDSLAIARV